MRKPMERTGMDTAYLLRCKQSTPEQRLDWLAAAREFVLAIKPSPKKKLPKAS